MKQPNPVLKVAVVVCSVLLVGGFIAFRAGAFDRLFRSGAPTVDPGNGPNLDGRSPAHLPSSKIGIIDLTPSGEQSTPPRPPDPTIIYSTKSAPVFTPVQGLTPAPNQPGTQTPTPTPPAPIILSGSKSIAPLIVPPAPNPPPAQTPPTPQQPTPNTTPPKPTIIPSSKSGGIFLPPPSPPPPPTKE